MSNFTLEKTNLQSIWHGHPDVNYSWEGERLSWERTVKNENGDNVTVKTYKDPIRITGNFKAESKIYGIEGNIEKKAVEKFGGALKGFVWADNIFGGGEVVLPFTAPHIFIAIGERLNPVLTEIGTSGDNYYEVVDGKTHVHVSGFSGVGAAAGSPPALIAHYKMNDNLATDVIIDETGSHNGVIKDATGTATSTFHSVGGKINLAQDQDGTDDYIEITDHADFTPALTPFSVSVWVYMHDATSFRIASKGVYNTDGEWLFHVDGSDYLYAEFYDESVASCYIGRKYTGATLTAYQNTWIHLVVTYDGGTTSASIKLYLNATRVDDGDAENNAGSFVAVENLTHAVWIGRYSANYADGVIDNVMFFSKELTPDEIKRIYNNGHGTEILAEVDGATTPRRDNTSPISMRKRYEF